MTVYETADGLPGLALGEWQSGLVPGLAMSQRDLRLADRLRRDSRDAQLDVQPTLGGVSVRATGVVGVVRFEGFEVRIDPKLPGDHLQLLKMVEFAEGIEGLTQLAGTPALREADPNLLDLVIELLCAATKRLLVGGLRADYVEREDDLPALRGRLLLDRQYLERFGLFDRIVCRYDEYEQDIPDNQLLALALADGSRTATLPRVRRRARGLAALLEQLCDPRAFELSLGPDAISYGRENEHYRAAHVLAWMVLRERSLDEALASGPRRVGSFLIDMNTLFEHFVEQLLQFVLKPSGIGIAAQSSHSIFWRPDLQTRYAGVRPDILLDRGQGGPERLPLDAKYKRYDSSKVEVGDLTQVFLYAYAYRQTPAAEVPRAVLLHPSETPGVPVLVPLQVHSVDERSVDAEIAVLGVHIPTVLAEVKLGWGPALEALRVLLLAQLPSAAITVGAPLAAADAGASASLPA